MLEAAGADLDSFDAKHREKLPGSDGVYEIDISVRFNALDANFLVLIECKHQKDPIKRDIVQILHDRIRSTGAHKGIVFSTSSFQSGAVEYAAKHGIGLVILCNGSSAWITKSADVQPSEPPPWANIPAYMGYFNKLNEEGNQQFQIVSERHSEYLIEFLALPDNAHTDS